MMEIGMKKQIKIIISVAIIAIIILALFLFMPTSSKPAVVFEMDDDANTITVIEVNDPDLYWKDLTLWTSEDGSADMPLDSEIVDADKYSDNVHELPIEDLINIGALAYTKVEVGDKIIYCQDNIALYVTETNELLGNWTFSYDPKPPIFFEADAYNRTLIIYKSYLELFDYKDMEFSWSDVEIGYQHCFMEIPDFPNIDWNETKEIICELPSGIIKEGDEIKLVSGIGCFDLIWTPSGETIDSFQFDETIPGILFEKNTSAMKVTVKDVQWVNDVNWSDVEIGTWPSENVIVSKPTGLIKSGDEIIITDWPEDFGYAYIVDEIILSLSWNTTQFAWGIENWHFPAS